MRVFDADRAQELFDTYRVWNHANTAALLGRFDGVDDVLLRLAAAGAAIGVATSKSRDAVDLAFSIQPPVVPFQAVVTVEDSALHKPHPEPVLTAIARLGSEIDDAVYVGDAPYDIEAARGRRLRRRRRDLGRRHRRRPGRGRRAMRSPRRRPSSRRSCWGRRDRRPRARIDELRAQIHGHDHAYYVNDAPTADDATYDALLRELRRARGRPPRPRHGRLAHAARRRRPAGGSRRGAPPAADAVARERPQRGRAGGVGRAGAQAAGARPASTRRRATSPS